MSAKRCLLGTAVRVAACSRQLLPMSQRPQLCYQLLPPASDKPVAREGCKRQTACSSRPSCLGPANGSICPCPVPRERPGSARCRSPSGVFHGKSDPKGTEPRWQQAMRLTGTSAAAVTHALGSNLGPSCLLCHRPGTSTCHQHVWPHGDQEKMSFLGACSSPV